MSKLISIVLAGSLLSCNPPSSKQDKKMMDFGAFTIEAPSAWKQIKEKGIDSYVGRIAIDDTDTIEFDLGWYSNTLTEDNPLLVERSTLKHSSLPTDTSEMAVVESIKDIDLDVYRKQNVSWDTIDGYRAKIVYTRQSRIGITGVYIDSLWPAGADNDRFNLCGANLKAQNEERLLEAIRTLRFRRRK